MMKKVLLMAIVVATSVFSAMASAAELKTPEEARDFGNELIIDIGKGNVNDAWSKMKTNTTIPPGRIDSFAAGYNSQFTQTIRYYGPSIGMELISAELSGESVLRLTYLIKYEVTGVSWFLTFYKGRENWVLTDFNYDLNMNSIFID